MGALDDAIEAKRRRQAELAARKPNTIPFSSEFKEAVREFLTRVPGPRTSRVGLFKRYPKSWTLLEHAGDGMGDTYTIVGVQADGEVFGRAVAAPGHWVAGYWESRVVLHIGAVRTDDRTIERATIEKMAEYFV
jgi:hypothetical protein